MVLKAVNSVATDKSKEYSKSLSNFNPAHSMTFENVKQGIKLGKKRKKHCCELTKIFSFIITKVWSGSYLNLFSNFAHLLLMTRTQSVMLTDLFIITLLAFLYNVFIWLHLSCDLALYKPKPTKDESWLYVVHNVY